MNFTRLYSFTIAKKTMSTKLKNKAVAKPENDLMSGSAIVAHFNRLPTLEDKISTMRALRDGLGHSIKECLGQYSQIRELCDTTIKEFAL